MYKKIIKIFILVIVLFVHYNYQFKTINYKVNNNVIIMGNIVIPKINLNKPIVYGFNQKLIDQNYVVSSKNFQQLDSINYKIMLAGHANNNVFGDLKKLSNEDKIIINYNKKDYTYIINKIIRVTVNDTKYLNDSYKFNGIILITCVNENTRLLIFAKKNDYVIFYFIVYGFSKEPSPLLYIASDVM